MIKNNIVTGEIVLSCLELNPTLSFFVDELAFQVDKIMPADNPSLAVLNGYGIRLRILVAEKSDSNLIRLSCHNPNQLFAGKLSITAPNGTQVELVEIENELKIPSLKAQFSHCQMTRDSNWVTGRAGMRYRDLIPSRLGGRFIASHIQIEKAGEVADYPHYHQVRFQLIYCYKGWAKLVYQDQGEPFYLKAGDCVLQPPGIRHRVLESSHGLEVIEVGCPAEHETFADHSMQLPTAEIDGDRKFAGQSFVRHQAKDASWKNWRVDGFLCRDIGLAPATDGLLGAYVIRPQKAYSQPIICHHEELLFLFVLKGSFRLLRKDNRIDNIKIGDALTIPAGTLHQIDRCSDDLEVLEIRLSDQFKTSTRKSF